jgi:hypothetical protein
MGAVLLCKRYMNASLFICRDNQALEVLVLRSWHLVLGLIVLTGAAYAVVVTEPLMDDTFISQASPEMSFSENDTLWAISEGGKPISEAYLGFNNSFSTVGVISPNNVASAALKLYATEVKKPGNITAYLVHGSPALITLNWNDKVNYDTEANATISIDKEGEYTLDVTSLIKRAVATCEGGCPYSIVLIPQGEASIGFVSMESSDKEKMASLKYTAT